MTKRTPKKKTPAKEQEPREGGITVSTHTIERLQKADVIDYGKGPVGEEVKFYKGKPLIEPVPAAADDGSEALRDDVRKFAEEIRFTLNKMCLVMDHAGTYEQSAGWSEIVLRLNHCLSKYEGFLRDDIERVIQEVIASNIGLRASVIHRARGGRLQEVRDITEQAMKEYKEVLQNLEYELEQVQ